MESTLEQCNANGSRRPPNKILTLLFVQERGKLLLGMKKRGFGKGRWNGFGGKVQVGEETIEEGAIRETKEECGLDVTSLDKVGVIMFEFIGQPQLMEVHVFRTHQYTGTPVETEEMRPQWFAYSDIPYDSMWPDDYMWYPQMLRGHYLDAYFLFEGYDEVLKAEIVRRNTSKSP